MSGDWDIRQGNVLDLLRAMPSNSVQCVVTSPPYYGLRAYKTEPQVWGGTPECPGHVWSAESSRVSSGGLNSTTIDHGGGR